MSEAPSFGKPILLYDVECHGSRSYMELAAEIISAQDTRDLPVTPPVAPVAQEAKE